MMSSEREVRDRSPRHTIALRALHCAGVMVADDQPMVDLFDPAGRSFWSLVRACAEGGAWRVHVLLCVQL